ncbi:MAG: FecR domain-containing protein [Candidatus Omnitrophica bacterium]|nr:FecR domain-containing protein [Candidatus Omnitrophota bacterium]
MVLNVGKVLHTGAIIRTASGSQVDLFLKQNGPVVRITADTTLGLDKLLYEETGEETIIDTQLNLTNGRILGSVKKLAEASKYEVKVPTGTVGIRGTEYDISTSGIVHVVTGSVLVTYISPSGAVRQYTVNAGQTFTPPPASTPEAPGTVTNTPPPVAEEMTPVFDQMQEVAIEGTRVVVVTPTVKPTIQPESVPLIMPPLNYPSELSPAIVLPPNVAVVPMPVKIPGQVTINTITQAVVSPH